MSHKRQLLVWGLGLAQITTSISYHPVIHSFYEQLVARGKPKKVALGPACASCLLS